MLYFAEQNKKLVHIDEVETGEKCNCTCPYCGDALIAKNGGKVKIHHFAHKNAECKYGGETSLHLLTKEIIQNGCEILIPQTPGIREYLDTTEFRQRAGIFGSAIEKYNGKDFFNQKNEWLMQSDSVKLEKKISSIIPDVIVNYKGHELIIEIFVTHKVDSEKEEKIRQLGISAIEIDLSNKGYVEKEDLIQVLSTAKHKWIYHAPSEKQKERVLQIFDNDYKKEYVDFPYNKYKFREGQKTDSPCKNKRIDGKKQFYDCYNDCPYMIYFDEYYIGWKQEFLVTCCKKNRF